MSFFTEKDWTWSLPKEPPGLLRDLPKTSEIAIFIDNHNHLTYVQLHELIMSYVSFFIDSAHKGIGIYADNSWEWVIMDVALLEAQITCVPFPPFY